jgi:hypothetical protein
MHLDSLQRKFQPSLVLGHTVEGKQMFALSGTAFDQHKVISGITGAGKSFFLASIFLLIFRLGITVVLIDPNGDLAKLILTLLASSDYFTDSRSYSRLWYVDFKRSEKDYAIAFNVLNQPYEPHTTANNLLESMHRAFPVSSTTANLDNVLLAACLVLIENALPITELPPLILDAQFRDSLLLSVSDPLVVQFFKSKFGDKVNSSLVDSTMRRSFLLTFSPVLRNTLGQRVNKLNMRHILDAGISCIFNLGGLDDQSKRLLGGALLVNIEQAFLSRADLDPVLRKPAHVIIDEFPVFTSHSEQSFSVILEQLRKYKATLYLAHQTQSQLSSGMAGSLQNAVSVNMKSGYTDSSTLVQQFYRPLEDKSHGFFDTLLRVVGIKPLKPRSIFADVTNTNEAKYLFETLDRQEAIVTLNGVSTLIKTNTIPTTHLKEGVLQEVEDTYAAKLLTPLSQVGIDTSASHLTLVSSSVALAKRRVPLSSTDLTPSQTFVGAVGNDEQLQAIFSQYGYLTVAMLAKLLQKTQNTARNKLKKLVDNGVLEAQSVPRTTPSGKTPLVYTLAKKGVRKHEFLEHAIAASEILLSAALLPTIANDLTILDIRSDHYYKTSPITLPDGNRLVPDGCVRLCSSKYEYVLYIEVDRNSESRDKIVTKLNNYKLLASQSACMAVAFCVVSGGDLRVKTLRNWAADAIQGKLHELFLYAPLDPTSLTPDNLYLAPTWQPVGENMLQPLIVL